MLYDIPKYIKANGKQEAIDWPKGVGTISATLSNGETVEIPVQKDVNYLTFGTTGSGKTISFTKPAAEILLKANPEMKAVFFEIKNTFLQDFMQEDDKVITHNPAAVPEKNLFIPNIIKEIRQSPAGVEAEMREIADFLFADLLDGASQNAAWIQSARNTFIAVLRTIVDLFPEADTGNGTLLRALQRMSIEETLHYIAKHPANHSLLRKDWGYDPQHPEQYKLTRRAQDINFFFSQALENFSGTFAMDGENTLQEFLDGMYGRNLFFYYDVSAAAICRPFFLYYLKKIVDYKLSNSAKSTPQILMILDEADKLSSLGKAADFGLFQAATLGRENHLQILLTIQSIEQMYGLASNWNEHIAISGMAGFPCVLSFRTGDSSTISALQTLFGSEYKSQRVPPGNRYGTTQILTEMRPIFEEAELTSLDKGDCVIKIFSHRPQRVHIHINH